MRLRPFIAVLVSLFFVFATGFAQPQTADLSDFWRSARPVRGGVTIDTFFTLKQSGTQINGTVHYHWGDLGIRDGLVDGNKVSFKCGDLKNPIVFTGTFADGELRLTTHDPNVAPWDITARRASTELMKPAAPIEPPELRDVPWNKLAATPPMGWNSWNHFNENVDDATVRATADAMVATGMKDAGYEYVVIDDTWEGARDADGNIVPNSKFPDMKALAAYVHSKGLKLGIYSSPGVTTCGGYTGSYGREDQDAHTFAQWGIDYLKYDWCSAFRIYKETDMRAIYQKMGEALQHSGRPIVYSLCQYGMQDVWKWGPQVGGNLWRTTGDIADNWASMSSNGFDKQVEIAHFGNTGHWNDPDMLEIGNGGMTDTEYRTHMSLWSLLAAPLMAGNDLRSMSPQTLAILTNREVIAVNQDKMGLSGQRRWKEGDLEVWIKPLSDRSWGVGLFNRGDKPARFSLPWGKLGLRDAESVRDLWTHADVTGHEQGFDGTVEAHGVVMLRVYPKLK